MNDSQCGTGDPEILALLDFDAAPRKRNVEGAWTPELQREFIARLAVTGSPGRAAEEMGKDETGIRNASSWPDATRFRNAWDAAIALAGRRKTSGARAVEPVRPGSRPPSLGNRRKAPESTGAARAAAPPGGLGAAVREAIPVVCDKCACDGFAGDDKFAGIPDILMFEPVRMPFGDKGWDEARQRAFIAALAVTGSTARAARSVGRHELGAERLRKMRGARGFSEAWDAALEIARDRELMRLGGTLEGLSSGSVEAASYDEDGQYSARLNDEAREQLVNKLLRLKKRKEAEARAEEGASRGVNP